MCVPRVRATSPAYFSRLFLTPIATGETRREKFRKSRVRRRPARTDVTRPIGDKIDHSAAVGRIPLVQRQKTARKAQQERGMTDRRGNGGASNRLNHPNGIVGIRPTECRRSFCARRRPLCSVSSRFFFFFLCKSRALVKFFPRNLYMIVTYCALSTSRARV